MGIRLSESVGTMFARSSRQSSFRPAAPELIEQLQGDVAAIRALSGARKHQNAPSARGFALDGDAPISPDVRRVSPVAMIGTRRKVADADCHHRRVRAPRRPAAAGRGGGGGGARAEYFPLASARAREGKQVYCSRLHLSHYRLDTAGHGTGAGREIWRGPARTCTGAQSKCGGRAIKGTFRRTIGENIGGVRRTLFETERTLVETDARSRCGDGRKVEIDDGFQRLGRRAVAQALGHCREPIRVGGLEREQLVDRIAPTLWPTAPIDGAA